MKFIVSSTTLLQALQSLGKVIASKNTLPILDSFLFELAAEKLIITASDSETVLTSSIEVSLAEGAGQFAIEAKRLLDPLKELPEQPLTVEIDDETFTAVVNYENGKFSLQGLSGDAYPQHKPVSETAIAVTLDSTVLLSGVSRTLFAAGEDELRPVMNGVFFDIKPESLTFVASDGRKLVRIRNFAIKSQQDASFILPKKPANLLKGMLARNSEITLVFDENNAYFKAETFEMVCRLIEGRYPNYEAVIPKENPNIVTIDRQSFLNAVKRVSVFSSAGANKTIRLDITDDNIKLSAQDLDFATSAEETVACQYADTPLAIGFNPQHLIEFLSNMTAPNVILKLGDMAHAGLVLPATQEDDEDLVMLAMPLQLND
jgi:DNA polymerase-3 subunit beta